MRKKIKVLIKLIFILVFCVFSYVLISTPFDEIYNLPDTVSITYSALDELNNEKPFGKFITFKNENTTVQASSSGNIESINVKLLNLFTIKKLKVGLNSSEVYAGGDTVGFSLNSQGVILIGHSNIVTKEGNINTLENSNLVVGDTILKFNETEIQKVSDINNFTKTIKTSEPITVTAMRNDEFFETIITPALDSFSNSYKLGIWVKDETSGIGTLTYIKKEDGNFGALGHAICDNETTKPFNVKNGDMFPCTILGIKKGNKGNPGEVKALFLQKKPIGEVTKNSKFGLYGKMDINSTFLTNKETFSTGGRLTARPGKAKIRTDISGELKDYDVEIIKTNYQNFSNEKSMVIKVIDKTLLNLTGGIVQGMSGSPIIQNNKIIGAVTHVFVNDPAKGFGIYLDWMIN